METTINGNDLFFVLEKGQKGNDAIVIRSEKDGNFYFLDGSGPIDPDKFDWYKRYDDDVRYLKYGPDGKTQKEPGSQE